MNGEYILERPYYYEPGNEMMYLLFNCLVLILSEKEGQTRCLTK